MRLFWWLLFIPMKLRCLIRGHATLVYSDYTNEQSAQWKTCLNHCGMLERLR